MSAVIAFGVDGANFLARFIGETTDPYTGRVKLFYRDTQGRLRHATGHMDIPRNVVVLPRRDQHEPIAETKEVF